MLKIEAENDNTETFYLRETNSMVTIDKHFKVTSRSKRVSL